MLWELRRLDSQVHMIIIMDLKVLISVTIATSIPAVFLMSVAIIVTVTLVSSTSIAPLAVALAMVIRLLAWAFFDVAHALSRDIPNFLIH